MSTYYADDDVTLYHGDALAVMASLPDASVDLIVTDPPYNVTEINGRDGTTVGRVRRKDGTYREVTKNFGDWDREYDPQAFLTEAARVLVHRGGLLAFTSDRLIGDYVEGPLYHMRTLVWKKTNPAPQFPGNYQAACEWIIWQGNGGPPKFNAGGATSNVYNAPIPANKSHPCEKPLSIIERLIERHSDPGDVVLDPYAGSGTTLRAAKDLGRKAIGVELDERHCMTAARRLSQGVLNLTGTDT